MFKNCSGSSSGIKWPQLGSSIIFDFFIFLTNSSTSSGILNILSTWPVMTKVGTVIFDQSKDQFADNEPSISFKIPSFFSRGL